MAWGCCDIQQPQQCEIIKRGKANTKLHIKLYNSKSNELRRVFRKFSLRVNSLERISFGPYRVSEVPNPGEFKEVVIRDEFRHLMGLFYREKLTAAVDAWNERKSLLGGKKPKLIAPENEQGEMNENENNLLTPKILDQPIQ